MMTATTMNDSDDNNVCDAVIMTPKLLPEFTRLSVECRIWWLPTLGMNQLTWVPLSTTTGCALCSSFLFCDRHEMGVILYIIQTCIMCMNIFWPYSMCQETEAEVSIIAWWVLIW